MKSVVFVSIVFGCSVRHSLCWLLTHLCIHSVWVWMWRDYELYSWKSAWLCAHLFVYSTVVIIIVPELQWMNKSAAVWIEKLHSKLNKYYSSISPFGGRLQLILSAFDGILLDTRSRSAFNNTVNYRIFFFLFFLTRNKKKIEQRTVLMNSEPQEQFCNMLCIKQINQLGL